jgi:asparagine synthase (glutamine-hydrolysing)
MCGIAGFMLNERAVPPRDVLDTMQQALAHRGPDGAKRHIDYGLGLVHTRLSIIDLKTGDQPLFGPNGTLLVANGEIYNYIELKKGFPAERFATSSDCELPLMTYAAHGVDFAKPLRGMYAIALADPKTGALVLSRDPFGIKPLYYAEVPNGILFASEPQAILKTGLVARGVSTKVATELMQLQFTTGTRTIFPGINRVAPGETMMLRQGRITERHHIDALPHAPSLALNEEEALVLLESALKDSVLVHQRSDVPYGMFLSGGIDSSALLALMARLNDRPVQAFTAGFPGTEARDERAHAKAVARAAGAEHFEIEVTENDFWTTMPAIAEAMDDPAADYAILPTYLLAREAARRVKVVLCGEGGDELFAGYGRYRSALRSRWFGGRQIRHRGLLDGLGVLRDPAGWRQGIEEAEKRIAAQGGTRLQQAQALDCADWLPNDLLLKVDRCLMAHGLEGRTPFLDPKVAELALRLPDGLKIRNGAGKYILRKWLARALPAADAFSRKRGFTVPVAEWIAKRARALAPLVARAEGIEQICDPGRVETLFHDFGNRGGKHEGTACWQLLFYALWYRIHIEGRSSRGDIMSVLEAR